MPFDPRSGFGGQQGMTLIDLVRSGRGGGGRGRPRPDWAVKQAMALINAQVKAINEAKRLYQEEYQKEAQLEMERGQALGNWLQQQDFAGRIGSIWGNAAGDVRGLGAAMGAAQAGQANAQGADLNRMVSGTGQEGTVATDGGLLGDITYGTGGELPSAAMDYTGKGWASDAALQPAFAARMGTQKAGDVTREGVKGLKDFLLQIAEAKAQRPGLIRELRDQRSEQKIAAEDRRFERYLRLAALALQQGKFQQAQGYLDLAVQDRQRAANKDRGFDVNGKLLPGWKMGPNGPIPPGMPGNPKAGSGSSGGGGKPVNWGTLQEEIADDLKTMYDEVENPESRFGGTVQQPWDWDRAFNALMSRFSGQVKNKGRLKRLIRKILIQNGWVEPKSPGPDGPH